MNKDKIITIRISGETYSKIKKTSDTVSEFVRKAVDNTINAAKNLKNSVEVKTHEEESAPQFYAFQNVIISKEVQCENCKKSLLKGESAYIGFDSESTKPHFICTNCKTHLEEVKESPVSMDISDDEIK